MTDSYHDDHSHVSKSMLTIFCDSPSDYYRRFVSGEMPAGEPTSAMEVGTACHAILLEGKTVDDVVAVYPDECLTKDGKLNWRRARDFRAEIAPTIAMKEAEAERVAAIIASVKQTQLWDCVQQATEHERRHNAVLYGVPSKCKPDMACDMGEHWLIYDLKFSSPLPDQWQRSARRFRYWLQDAHYSQVIAQETGKPVQFRFWVIEPTFPYRIHSYWYDPRSRELAGEFHCRVMTELYECYKSGDWSDKWPSEMTLSPWEVGYEDVQLVGFEDDE